MPGPAPKLPEDRRNRAKPRSGEWQTAPGYGWQHGDTPKPPKGLTAEGRRVWRMWMASWAASFWVPDDLAGIETTVRLFEVQLVNPTASNATALGQWMDRYGLTPKGLQQRHWLRPREDTASKPVESKLPRLKVVGE